MTLDDTPERSTNPTPFCPVCASRQGHKATCRPRDRVIAGEAILMAERPREMELHVDSRRTAMLAAKPVMATHIFVRALQGLEWRNADIFELDDLSLDLWLRSRGTFEWPIGVVKLLLWGVIDD